LKFSSVLSSSLQNPTSRRSCSLSPSSRSFQSRVQAYTACWLPYFGHGSTSYSSAFRTRVQTPQTTCRTNRGDPSHPSLLIFPRRVSSDGFSFPCASFFPSTTTFSGRAWHSQPRSSHITNWALTPTGFYGVFVTRGGTRCSTREQRPLPVHSRTTRSSDALSCPSYATRSSSSRPSMPKTSGTKKAIKSPVAVRFLSYFRRAVASRFLPSSLDGVLRLASLAGFGHVS